MVLSGEAAERSMSDDSRSAISMAPVLLPFLGSPWQGCVGDAGALVHVQMHSRTRPLVHRPEKAAEPEQNPEFSPALRERSSEPGWRLLSGHSVSTGLIRRSKVCDESLARLGGRSPPHLLRGPLVMRPTLRSDSSLEGNKRYQ